MAADFWDAHNRHWDDAVLLYENSCWANADQLFGLSSECALKALMLAFGVMPYDYQKDRPKEKDDAVHINQLWGRYITYLSGSRTAKYLLDPTNPFDDWNISQRYDLQSNFHPKQVDPHFKGTTKIRDLILEARREGLV